MKNNKYHLVSLGCSKNLVDSYSIATILNTQGYQHTDNVDNANFIIINTCGFIDIAREESISTIKTLIKNKNTNQKIIVTGCLSERYKEVLSSDIPGIDAIYGTRRWMDIDLIINKLQKSSGKSPIIHFPYSPTIGSEIDGFHRIAIQGGSAYLKISDGCRRSCSYCAIPLIKGRSKSRSVDSIMNDLQYLEDKNLKEVILIAQDSTDYGYDIGLKDGLSMLLQQMLNRSISIPWVRFLYAYPGLVTDRLIDLMANNANIIPYLDLPLQHAHPDILKSMRRPSNIDWVYRTIEKIRNAIPNISIRTTFIVGYPGETEEHFSYLENFLKDIKFDRVGIFKYSFEKDVPAEKLGDPIPENIKNYRVEKLMHIQESISLEINKTFINKNMEILVEGKNEEYVIGRSYRDAPEIDGLVIAEGNAKVGDFAKVKINNCSVHDLFGKII